MPAECRPGYPIPAFREAPEGAATLGLEQQAKILINLHHANRKAHSDLRDLYKTCRDVIEDRRKRRENS